jgi:sulfhydrogenase subunit gamma (sulfur reductase)
MAPVFHKVEIVDVKDLTGDVKEFTLSNPGGEFTPGQFATIKIEDGQAPVCMRSYSVLTGDEGKLQMIIKKVEGGRGTAFLFGREKGDALQMLYPLGHFGLPSTLGEKLTFIGTGTGVAPLLCMIESLPASFEGEVKLIFGVRFASDLFYLERIEKIEQKLKNFKLVATVSRPQDGWSGHKGRVTEYLKEVDINGQFFICGTHQMILDVKNLLTEKGVPKENVYFENFG